MEDEMTSNTTLQIWNGAINALVQTVIGLTLLCSTGSSARSDDATQTLVFIRHGEKPDEGLGQLSCQGLNRALALPPVIAKSFGRPDYIYAPDPSVSKKDAGELYDYVRPLATVEPTAIFFTLPVDTSFGFSDIIDLQAALEKRLSARRDTLILIAWEHKQIEDLVKGLLDAHGGDPALVPKWHGSDFDSIYVVTVSKNGGAASFALKREGLDGQPTSCPH
jgi:hypothetical protein